METQTVGNPGGKGIFPGEYIAKNCTFTEAANKGEVVMFDFLGTAATSNSPGASGSKWNTVRDPDTGGVTTTGLNAGVFGIAMATVAAGGEGDVLVEGIFDTADVDGSTAEGSLLVPATDGQLDVATGTSGKQIVAIALEADASNVAAIYFRGWGFGQDGGTPA